MCRRFFLWQYGSILVQVSMEFSFDFHDENSLLGASVWIQCWKLKMPLLASLILRVIRTEPIYRAWLSLYHATSIFRPLHYPCQIQSKSVVRFLYCAWCICQAILELYTVPGLLYLFLQKPKLSRCSFPNRDSQLFWEPLGPSMWMEMGRRDLPPGRDWSSHWSFCSPYDYELLLTLVLDTDRYRSRYLCIT